MRSAIFYLTYNGVFNNTNGIGTQTKTFLSGMARYRAELEATFGPLAVHLVSQICRPDFWGYSETDLAYARAVTASLDGAVHFCPYLSDAAEFWQPASWRTLSAAAAALVLEHASAYDRVLVIANDIPFLHAPLVIEQARHDFAAPVQSLIALYGSTFVHLRDRPDPERLAWERQGLAWARPASAVRLGRFSDFMHDHFVECYGVEPAAFAPYRSSLDLGSEEYLPLSEAEAAATLREHNIPLDRPLVFAFGRADPIKGFDLLLDAAALVQGARGLQAAPAIHLVLNVVPYAPDDPILDGYRAAISRHGLDATLLTRFSRRLPRALCAWPATRLVVCPSRGEPLSNIPFEVALWARDRGPVLVCSNIDGFPEQIRDGEDGYLFESGSVEALAAAMLRALAQDEPARRALRRAAYRRVLSERDFRRNFAETLGCFWGA